MRGFGTLVIAALMAAVGSAATAQDAFPSKQVTMVVPYPPGGPNDIVARVINEPLGRVLGQPVVVDNRGGAGGNLGTIHVARAEPDGHTLLLQATPLVVNPLLYKDAGYALGDLDPVAMVVDAPMVVVVNKDFPAKTMAELADYAKANPGKASYATSGYGGSLHLLAERFMQLTGTEMKHVIYKGNAAAIPDLLNGQVQLMFSSIGTALPHIQSGELKALAVTTIERAPVLPDVPGIGEAGFAELDYASWFTLMAPKGTPEPVREKLNAALQEVLAMPEVVDAFAKVAYAPRPMSVADTGAYINGQGETWAKLIEERGIRGQ